MAYSSVVKMLYSMQNLFDDLCADLLPQAPTFLVHIFEEILPLTELSHKIEVFVVHKYLVKVYYIWVFNIH